MTDIIDNLIEHQRQEHLTDSEFALKLGIHRVSWHRIKHRKVPYGNRFCKAVKAQYPDIFLPSNATISHDFSSISEPRAPYGIKSLTTRLFKGLKQITGGKDK
jgi:hypothetical protein